MFTFRGANPQFVFGHRRGDRVIWRQRPPCRDLVIHNVDDCFSGSLSSLPRLALIGSTLSLGPGVYFLSVNASGFLASLFQKKKRTLYFYYHDFGNCNRNGCANTLFKAQEGHSTLASLAEFYNSKLRQSTRSFRQAMRIEACYT
jgi:hypothetical protein